MSLPAPYFEVMCCPACRSDLRAAAEDQLRCSSCGAAYPIVAGIPVLLQNADDEVSRIVKAFYDTEWQRDAAGQLRAVVRHADASDLGQKYVDRNEDRMLEVFKAGGGGRYFLDAACGATPRVRFGQKFDYHVCVDFSLDGLAEARQQLGERAVCICGSLLALPVKTAACAGVLASHCIYHIDKNYQAQAVGELFRTLKRGALMIHYVNPGAPELRFGRLLRRLLRRPAPVDDKAFYYEPLPRSQMMRILRERCPGGEVSVRHLRLVSKAVTQPFFRIPIAGKLAFALLATIEPLFALSARWATVISYVIVRAN